jgi:CheY-like chemotaxis protein
MPTDQACGALRVLVVDDYPDTVESLALLLGLWGCEVLTAFDGPGALSTALSERPDAVLLDVGMPGLDGFEVARRLRAHPATQKVLLVAVTACGQEGDRLRSRQAGFDHHLLKPVEPQQLLRLLAEVPARAPAGPAHSGGEVGDNLGKDASV